MKFAKADAYHARSDCGGYTITTEPGLYMAWRAHRHARGRELLSHHHYPPDDRQARIDALRAAERACEMDASHAR